MCETFNKITLCNEFSMFSVNQSIDKSKSIDKKLSYEFGKVDLD